MTPPPEKHEVVEKDGYRLTFYPGFLSRASVDDESGRTELYAQSGSHDVRDLPDEPLTRHVLRLEGGPNQRDVTLTLDDPRHAVAEIVVRLYPAGYTPGDGEAPEPVETMTATDGAILCPPVC